MLTLPKTTRLIKLIAVMEEKPLGAALCISMICVLTLLATIVALIVRT